MLPVPTRETKLARLQERKVALENNLRELFRTRRTTARDVSGHIKDRTRDLRAVKAEIGELA